MKSLSNNFAHEIHAVPSFLFFLDYKKDTLLCQVYLFIYTCLSAHGVHK